jgi:hypothetical protein
MVPKPAPADWQERLGDVFEIEVVTPVGEGGDQAHVLELLLHANPGMIVALGLDGDSVHTLRLRNSAPLAKRVPPGGSERWAAIPPNVLRYGVLEPLWGITDDDLRAGVVEYNHDAGEVIDYGRDHPGSVCFLLNPVGIDAVMALADQGERMPQKSTFFHPKLGTGLVFNPLEP